MGSRLECTQVTSHGVSVSVTLAAEITETRGVMAQGAVSWAKVAVERFVGRCKGTDTSFESRRILIHKMLKTGVVLSSLIAVFKTGSRTDLSPGREAKMHKIRRT